MAQYLKGYFVVSISRFERMSAWMTIGTAVDPLRMALLSLETDRSTNNGHSLAKKP